MSSLPDGSQNSNPPTDKPDAPQQAPQESNLVNPPPQRGSRLSTLLPISNAVVSHPTMKETMFNNYMVYKVTFKFNDSDQEVSRRYSDFDSLRKAIKMYRPFNFVYPVHRKQFIVDSSGNGQTGVHQRPHRRAQQLHQLHPRPPRNLQHRSAHQTLSTTSSTPPSVREKPAMCCRK